MKNRHPYNISPSLVKYYLKIREDLNESKKSGKVMT